MHIGRHISWCCLCDIVTNSCRLSVVVSVHYAFQILMYRSHASSVLYWMFLQTHLWCCCTFYNIPDVRWLLQIFTCSSCCTLSCTRSYWWLSCMPTVVVSYTRYHYVLSHIPAASACSVMYHMLSQDVVCWPAQILPHIRCSCRLKFANILVKFLSYTRCTCKLTLIIPAVVAGFASHTGWSYERKSCTST